MNRSTPTCVITGCSTGIGKAAAMALAGMSYRIVMMVRDSDKSRDAQREINSVSSSGDIEMYGVDLASQGAVRSAVEAIRGDHSRIDVLINNAGTYKRKREITEDGVETTLAVNYLAPFLTTALMMPLLKASPNARIVNVASEMYKDGQADLSGFSVTAKHNGKQAYADSKLLLVVYTEELARRLQPDGITANSVHPGVIGTEAFREYPRAFTWLMNLVLPGPEVGAKPIVNLAASPDVDGISGRYFYKTEMRPPEFPTGVEQRHQEIWERSEKLVAEAGAGAPNVPREQ